MFMWFVIIGVTLAVFCCGLLYISFRAAHFAAVQRIAHGKRWLARLLCFLFFAALTAVLWIVWNMMNAIVCMIHLVLFWLLCDLAALIAAKIRKKPRKRVLGRRCGNRTLHTLARSRVDRRTSRLDDDIYL